MHANPCAGRLHPVQRLFWAAPFFFLAASSALGQTPAPTTPSAAAAAAVLQPPEIRAARRSGGVNVDGKLDEAAWTSAVPASEFTQTDPQEGRPGSERTEVRVLVDDEALYIGARLFDREPDKIRARLV